MSSLSTAPGRRPWDGFLVGPENTLAHAGIIALARGEQLGLSPLVLHGPSGVGKSRLLAGLVSECLIRHADFTIAHLQAETFANLCGEAASHPAGWSEFRNRFRQLGLFVLEDLHTLERAPLAVTELCHTLDALLESGALVALSARAGPNQWSYLPERLVNRLLGGLSIRIDAPGVSSRRRYILESARAKRLTLSADAVERLAEVTDGYRTIDGFLSRLTLDTRTTHTLLTYDVVMRVLDENGSVPRHTSIDDITRATAAHFGVQAKELRSSSRRAVLVTPRHLAIFLARRWTDLSFAAIGTYFGNRDAATVRYACETASRRLMTDPVLAAVAASLELTWIAQEAAS